MKVHVVSYDPKWTVEFSDEAGRIRRVISDEMVAIHHIGSTAIPGIVAKPIIDILLEVRNLQRLDSRLFALAELGYDAKGEFGIPGRRYFRKNSPKGERTHQIHAFEAGSVGSERHLAFRDYMIAYPGIAQSYSLLKQRLAAVHADDIEAYMDGKDSFIRDHEAQALLWRRTAQLIN